MDQRQRLLLQRTQASYSARNKEIRDKIDEFVTANWLGMGSWRDADMVVFQNRVIPVVLAGERQVAQLANTYLTTSRNLAKGSNESPRPLALDEVTGPALRGGLDLTEEYMRPQVVMNTALSKGASVTTAVSQGLERLRSLTATDLQLSKTHTVARQGQATWYRRTLTGAKNCALCVIATTQRYHHGNLMPIHPGCDCGEQEETSMADPGWVIDEQKLEQVHAAITDQFGATDRAARYIDGANVNGDYLDLMVTYNHGELGPTLAWRDQAISRL